MSARVNPPWTPPPWTAEGEQLKVVALPNRDHLVCWLDSRTDVSLAGRDAQLIAVAPDMAALLPDVIACLARYAGDDEAEDLAHRAAVLLDRAGGEALRPNGRAAVRAAGQMAAALEIVDAAIREEASPADDMHEGRLYSTWNDDHHFDVRLSVKECRQVLVAYGAANGMSETDLIAIAADDGTEDVEDCDPSEEDEAMLEEYP